LYIFGKVRPRDFPEFCPKLAPILGEFSFELIDLSEGVQNPNFPNFPNFPKFAKFRKFSPGGPDPPFSVILPSNDAILAKNWPDPKIPEFSGFSEIPEI